ncbi:MAG TPA: hypothetical protein VIY73_24955 [Polyangiaceae bacterium]
MELKNLIDPHMDLPRLAAVLDGLGTPARVWAVRQWHRETQAKLWEAVKGFRPVTLDDYVPPDVAPRVEVIHHGMNTLPAHNHFQKRFAKPADPETKDQLVGFNFQSLSGLTGPGYYVAHPAPDAGEVDIDYTMLPKEKPDAWPPIVDNAGKLGRFVYYGMIDVMRGISTHVSIGRAKKKNGWMDAWFVLVRDDTPADTAPGAEPHAQPAS